MGYDDNVVAWVHDAPTDGMAITIFGSLKSINSMKRIPSRIPISLSPYHHEREREYPNREREREPYPQQIDVRCLKNMKRLKNRIKASYSCNQQLCPMIKERMEQHQMDRHTSAKRGCDQDIDSQTVILPNTSRHRPATKSGRILVDSHSIQTNITHYETRCNNRTNTSETYLKPRYDYNSNANEILRHNNHYDDREPDRDEKRQNNHYNLNNNASEDSIPLRRTETRNVLSPKRNIYRDYVLREVKAWFQEVPIYPNLGNTNFDKSNVINDLTDKINRLLNEVNDEGYDRKVKCDIDSSLKTIPMWYPGAKRDQDSFKDRLNENLLNRIKEINKKLIVNNNNDNNKQGYRRISSNNSDTIRSSNRDSIMSSGEVEEEVTNWLSMIKFRRSSGVRMNVDKKEIANVIIKKIAPLLKKPMNCNYKSMLKCAIVDVLIDLPIGARCSRNRNVHLHSFADELTDRLLNIKNRYEPSPNRHPCTQKTHQTTDIYVHNITKSNFELMIHREVSKCLVKTRLIHNGDVKLEITNIIMDYIDSPVPVEEFNVLKEIVDVLRGASNMPEFLASNIAQNIIREVKYTLNGADNCEVSDMRPALTRKISVYTSEDSCCPSFPVTSTPKKKKIESVSKLNPEEVEYANKLENLIRAWMETLPEQFNAPDEKAFKEAIIKDLAGEITDQAKLEQLITVEEKEKWLKYLVYKWLHKLDIFDLEEVTAQIEDLLKRVKEIPVPVLTRPQHGNRQAMANVQHIESEKGWEEYFVPKGKDILEDEISIWMNQQSSDIFNIDKNTRNDKIHELAEVLQNKLTKKRPENEIKNDVEQWLNKIVRPEQQIRVGEFADNLRDRVAYLPQDATLAAERDKKVQQKAEHLEAKKNTCCPPNKTEATENDTANLDRTMHQFIGKYIEHNYDVDDPMARGAFSHLLKTKLQRLNPPTRKEVYDKFAKSEPNTLLSREKLVRELNYIKDVSDWLKNIPIDASFNTTGNRVRVDFVNDLARNILDVEEQREDSPEAMDYNMYMASIISQFLIQLPIKEEYKNDQNMMFMIDQLVGKVIVHRNKNEITNDSLDTSGVHSENIGDFIEEFIRVNGIEIADDEVKLEAWSARLLNEIKKMVRENANPAALSKAQVYNNLTTVPIPGDESIKQFDNELEYIKEICEWSKNLPLLPIDESDEEKRIKIICELTEKITERNNKIANNDDKTDSEFAEYISKWLSDLSLDESREIVASVVIQQLINRIERVKTRQEKPSLDFTKASETKLAENSKINKKQSSKTMKSSKIKLIKNPAGTIVDAIEKWSASLPIKDSDEKTVKSLKDDASKRLFQTVGELSIDPRTFNDDLLYQDILADEIDAVIEKLPQSPELESNKDKLKIDLVQNIVEAQKAIKENCAGAYYKQKLEHTIEASIPHPVQSRRAYDPGFEIYKSRLADIFILENFDHANDDVKFKYERRIKDEIDKYYDNVKNKNAIPLKKDEIYNELYSVLFKVPIPNESSVIGEVEEIKTRCEIDAWFEQLPLREADGITELLERDKILATLAKRIHEIENSESKPADKIHKEIMKWVVKLPLLPEEEANAEQFGKNLQDVLKSSADKRKCVASEPKSKKGKTKAAPKETLQVKKDNSQIPGPSTAINKGKQLERVKPKKKTAEIIIEIVEAWCDQLPISATTSQEEETAKLMRDNLSTKIIIKISELNMNPTTFNDDFQYDDLLDEELNKLLTVIPTCCDFEESKAARKMQLKDAIQSIKPLIKEEKARHQYKQDLNTIVDKVLGKPKDTSAEKEALSNDLKEEIVENFVQYNYDRDDDEGRQAYKAKVHDAVVKFLANIVENKDKTSTNPLLKRNQLLCELAKIPILSDDSVKEEVEELRMKNEVSELFDDIFISETNNDKNKLIKQVKSSLAKKLNDIEVSNVDIENKMKQEVTKSLKKLNKESKPEVIETFVNKLRINEVVRRAPRKVKTDTTSLEKCEMAGVCECDMRINKKNKEFKIELKEEKNEYIPQTQDASQNTETNCQGHCENSQNDSSKQDSKQKTNVCECSKTELPQRDREYQRRENSQNDSSKQDSKQKTNECECSKTELPQRDREYQRSENSQNNSSKQDSKQKTNVCECSKTELAQRDREYQRRENSQNDSSKQDSKQKTNECECSKTELPQRDREYQRTEINTNYSQDSNSNTLCEYSEQTPQKEREFAREREYEETEKETTDDERCTCGGKKGKKACFMPMRWYCNRPEELPVCRMPAFFYY